MPWFTGVCEDGVSLEYRQVFYPLLNRLVDYYKHLIKDVIENSGNKISLPMNTDFLQSYLTGWTLNYIGFNNDVEHRSGYWNVDTEHMNTINIYYNLSETEKRQRFTKIHETMHFLQWLDPAFQNFFDKIIIEELLPPELVIKLLEKATDKAAAIYLMPNKHFIKKWQEIKNVQKLSDEFQVSESAIVYRLKECGADLF